MKPMMSVLIAAHEAGDWLGEAVQSVLEQEPAPQAAVEILVGVDACEATWAVALKLDPSVRLFMAGENVGPYVVFNTLHGRTRGDLLVYHGADDLMEPDRLAAMERAVGRLRDRQGIVGTWVQDVDEGLVKGRRHDEPADGAVLLTRGLLERVGGYRPWRCAADTELVIRAMAMDFDATVVARHLLLRRVHPGQLTASAGTSYQSELRAEYVGQIEEQVKAWSAGGVPECIDPVTVAIVRQRDYVSVA